MSQEQSERRVKVPERNFTSRKRAMAGRCSCSTAGRAGRRHVVAAGGAGSPRAHRVLVRRASAASAGGRRPAGATRSISSPPTSAGPPRRRGDVNARHDRRSRVGGLDRLASRARACRTRRALRGAGRPTAVSASIPLLERLSPHSGCSSASCQYAVSTPFLGERFVSSRALIRSCIQKGCRPRATGPVACGRPLRRGVRPDRNGRT